MTPHESKDAEGKEMASLEPPSPHSQSFSSTTVSVPKCPANMLM